MEREKIKKTQFGVCFFQPVLWENFWEKSKEKIICLCSSLAVRTFKIVLPEFFLNKQKIVKSFVFLQPAP